MNSQTQDSLSGRLKKLPGEVKSLLEKRIELFTLEMGERLSNIITHAIYRVTGMIFLGLGLILVLFAAANLVGDLLENEGLGFVVVAAPILLLGLLLFSRRPRFMVRATRNKMMQQFMKDLSGQISNIESPQSSGTNPGPDENISGRNNVEKPDSGDRSPAQGAGVNKMNKQ